MSTLRTLLVVLIMLPVSARGAEDRLTQEFANCAGRLSAELEHAWLTDTESADEIERRYQTFVGLLHAIVDPDRESHALNMRIEAKVAHASLLTLATFSQDSENARSATRLAKSHIAYCLGFLLKS